MKVLINGKEKELAENLSIEKMLSAIDINREVVVIEYNEKILKKNEWAETFIKNGDIVEIISFVGGG